MADEVVISVRAEDNFSSTLGNFGNILTGIKSAIDLVGDGLRFMRDLALEGLDAVSFYERLTLSLTSLNAAQYLQAGTAKDMASAMDIAGVKAEELAQWMQELAIKSPFTLEGVANAFRTAQAYGFTADEAKRLTQALIDFSSATGATEYNMQRIAYALGQISTTGKLTGQDMMQLTNAGLPVAQILADAFGVTTAEIIRMRSEGLLPAQEVIEAITVWIETNFAGAAANFANSWAGLTSTFADIKQMGLRELFTGILEAIQPLVVEISSFLQGAGMQLLGQLGDMAGEFLANNDALQAAVDFVRELNIRILEGQAPLDAFIASLQNAGLGDVATRLQEFIDTTNTEGLGQAFKDLFTDIWSNIDLTSSFQGLLDNLANLMNNADWQKVGQVIGNVLSIAIEAALSGLDAIVNRIDWGPFGDALGDAIKEMWAGAWEDTSLSDSLKNAISWLWTGGRTEIVNESKANLRQMGRDMIQGLIDGMNSIEVSITDWVRNHIVTPIKEFLGIASPSTLFMQIGRDIVLGLAAGIASMLGTGLTIIQNIIDLLLAPIQPILDLLGIDLGGGTTGTTGGQTGTHTGPTGTGGVLTGTGTVNNYFYGPVYFGNLEQLGYDCPSPHPLLAASQGSLLHTVNVG